jgi:hypothetical protein
MFHLKSIFIDPYRRYIEINRADSRGEGHVPRNSRLKIARGAFVENHDRFVLLCNVSSSEANSQTGTALKFAS